MTMRIVVALSLLFSPVLLAEPSKIDTAAFTQCQEAVRRNAVDEAEKVCAGPVAQGIPGAEYGLGVLLVNRRHSGDLQAGIRLLEQAHAAGNPAAAFALSTVYGQDRSEEGLKRARALFQEAACAGYPAAVSALMKHGEEVKCPPTGSGFAGEWVGELAWVKSDLPTEGRLTLKISVGADKTVKVFRKTPTEWAEVKPGKFTVAVLDQTAVVSALDSGWDFEGKWIETWTIQLLKSGSDEAFVSFVRTVNNVNVPSTIPWHRFSALVEGIARRTQ